MSQRPNHDPTPEEIAAACETFKRRHLEQKRRARHRLKAPEYDRPELSPSELGLEARMLGDGLIGQLIRENDYVRGTPD